MKISVIIPIYNVEQYLRQCIESVLAQSYKDMEIILVNDGSPDNSLDICNEFAENHPCIKVIDKENGGISDARNEGIKNSTGEYLMFLDSDDYWGYNFLEELVNFLQKNKKPEYVIFRNKYYYEKTGNYSEAKYNFDASKLSNVKGINALNYILEKHIEYPWRVWWSIIKKELIIENDHFFIKGRNFEDILWVPKLFLIASTVCYFDHAPIFYRLEREGQITSTYNLKNLKDMIYVARYWCKDLKKYDVTENEYSRMMKNLASPYFVAIRYGGLLKKEEKKDLIIELKKNKELLNYAVNSMNRKTALACKIFGFSLSMSIFKIIMKSRKN
ncbi:glycosyltransferase involved in cell wall biosynthesis [Desulfitispora alkaliphila]|uniref:glycosyltransferase family 2 protein n=1 Tax=Desulfitispora alkaliphila TaxID=622674 RepID=UPI003D1E725B